MLKTPKFPVWVVKTGERYGVMFSLNKDLVNDWSVMFKYYVVFFVFLGSYFSRHD